jgi:hypothetical protein
MAMSPLAGAALSLLSATPPAILPTTPSGVLVLGDFVFQSYEIPEKIRWGDQQKNHVYAYPAGLRAVEALGPEPLTIGWSGRFQGSMASARARQLDIMCRMGNALALNWGELSFLVMICKFTATQEHNWQIPYAIECLVVSAPVGLPNDVTQVTPAAAIVGDAASAVGLGTQINSAGLTGALSTVQQTAAAMQTVVSQAGTVAGALGPPLAQLQTALGAAAGTASALAAAADGQIQAAAGGLAGVVTGAMGNANANALLSTLSAIEQASTSRLVQGLVGRMTKNSDEVMS